MSLGRTQTAPGAFYRRVAFRIGKAKAVTATARKLAILIYRTLKDGLVYADPGRRDLRHAAPDAPPASPPSAGGQLRIWARQSHDRRGRGGDSFLGAVIRTFRQRPSVELEYMLPTISLVGKSVRGYFTDLTFKIPCRMRWYAWRPAGTHTATAGTCRGDDGASGGPRGD
jgi:hypothetical protein